MKLFRTLLAAGNVSVTRCPRASSSQLKLPNTAFIIGTKESLGNSVQYAVSSPSASGISSVSVALHAALNSMWQLPSSGFSSRCCSLRGGGGSSVADSATGEGGSSATDWESDHLQPSLHQELQDHPPHPFHLSCHSLVLQLSSPQLPSSLASDLRWLPRRRRGISEGLRNNRRLRKNGTTTHTHMLRASNTNMWSQLAAGCCCTGASCCFWLLVAAWLSQETVTGVLFWFSCASPLLLLRKSTIRPQWATHEAYLGRDDSGLVPLNVAEAATESGATARCRIGFIHIQQGPPVVVLHETNKSHWFMESRGKWCTSGQHGPEESPTARLRKARTRGLHAKESKIDSGVQARQLSARHTGTAKSPLLHKVPIEIAVTLSQQGGHADVSC